MREPYTIKRIVEQTTEPISLAEAKSQCRIDGNDQDVELAGIITAARLHCEGLHKGRVYVTQTWRMTMEDWPLPVGGNQRIILPRAPVQSVSSITYVDVNGATQTLAANQYQVDTDSEPGVIAPAYGVTWPAVRPYTLNAIKVTFIAGYGLAAAVPANIKRAILLLVGHWNENRESVLTGTISKEIEFGVANLLGVDPVFPYAS